ncbi:MAG TPA: extracellular solute-binding protein, partial [Ktedonobacteraceae bacterium]|nr:extracellular solute-binding protein [Ktedonobacteraceae bacterium]
MPVFNRHQQRNTVEQLVEEYTTFRINRRQFMQRAMAVGLSTGAAVSLLEACGSPSPTVGSGTPTTVKSIDSLVVISGTELDNYKAVNAAFTAKTGITVNVESTRDLPTVLNTRIRGNNPPDIAAPPLGILQTLAGQGKLLRLDSFLDMSTINSNYSSTWINLVSVNGGVYGVPFLANTKGCIWYSPKQFQANGWTTPTTWQDMITLSNKI